MYWQTTEKSTLEQLKSTCNHTAQLKKKKPNQNNKTNKYILHLYQTLQITFQFLLQVMKEGILSITTAHTGGISEASMDFPLTHCGQGQLCRKRHIKKGVHTLLPPSRYLPKGGKSQNEICNQGIKVNAGSPLIQCHAAALKICYKQFLCSSLKHPLYS